MSRIDTRFYHSSLGPQAETGRACHGVAQASRAGAMPGFTGAALAAIVLLTAVLLTGCRHESIAPAPGEMPSAAVLIKTERIPLSFALEYRKYELLHSEVSNDFYPVNVGPSKPAGKLVPRLFVWAPTGWECLDYALMPQADVFNAPNLCPRNERVVFDRPDVTRGEGELPRLFGQQRRSHRTIIYHVPTRQRFTLDNYAEVYGVSMSSYWRPDSGAVAFTTTNVAIKPVRRELVVLDACGQLILDSTMLPELQDLEFIVWSKDGNKIAALASTEPKAGGRSGGKLFEIDLKAKAVKQAGEIPDARACKFPGRMDKLIHWDSKGGLSVRPPGWFE